MSTARASDIKVSDALAAFVAKDGSTLVVKDSHTENAKLACYMAYNKKPEYAGASIEVFSSVCDPLNQESTVQRGSTVRIDGVLAQQSKVDTEDLYSNQMRKHGQ